MALQSLRGNSTLIRWVLLSASLAFFSTLTTITIEVEAWVFHPDSSRFPSHQPFIRSTFQRRTTSFLLYQKGGGTDSERTPQTKDRKRQQSEFFFNTTVLRYTNDNAADIAASNETIRESPSSSSSAESRGSATGTFGDIMSPTIDDADLLFQDGLVTSETYSLQEIYGISNPLDRMAVTANGNLQRLFSSYYDAPVVVEMVHCTRQKSPDVNGAASSAVDATAIWDRRVLLKIFDDQTFCTADSVVEVHSQEVEDLVESGQVGIGQLFRHFNILPEFTLLAAGPSEDGGFWRNYTLESDLVTCSIREVFCKNVWELKPSSFNCDE